MSVIMRNRVTSEYRSVEADSSEYYTLRAELHTDGRPRWEQTGAHDAAGFASRLASGTLRPEDIGDQDQPIQQAVATDPGGAVGLDRGWPTPGEIEQRAGRARHMSDEELADISTRIGGPSAEGYPAGHPPQVDPDEAEEAGVSLSPNLTGGAGGSGDEVTDALADRVREANEGSDVVSALKPDAPEDDDEVEPESGSGPSTGTGDEGDGDNDEGEDEFSASDGSAKLNEELDKRDLPKNGSNAEKAKRLNEFEAQGRKVG